MSIGSSELWVQEARRAETFRPVPHDRRRHIVARSDHWVRRLEQKRSISAVANQMASLPGVYLQARESCAPRSRIPQDRAFAMLTAMSWSREDVSDDAGRPWSSRLTPSAGGTHCIEPLLWWEGNWFVATEGNVCQVLLPGEVSERLLRSVHDSVDETAVTAVLIAIADPRFLEQRYPGATSLMWRDAGAFLVISSLVAQAVGCQGRIAGIACLVDGEAAAMAVGAFWFGGEGVD